MKEMPVLIWQTLAVILFLFSCSEPCDKSLRIGEIVQIPVQFQGFGINEINQITVYRINLSDPDERDTFSLREILWVKEARSVSESITDHVPGNVQRQYGYYESYFDGCTLILDWYTGRDTLAAFDVKKSREQIKGCHENDPNVRLDRMSFTHKGRTVHKYEPVQISK